MIARITLSMLLVALVAHSANAAEAGRCLNAKERKAALATHHVVSLGKVIRQVKAHYPGDVVRVRLCRVGPNLAYVLTVLPRNGKVAQASIDAGSGALIGVH